MEITVFEIEEKKLVKTSNIGDTLLLDWAIRMIERLLLKG